MQITCNTDRIAGVVGWVDLSAHDAITTIDPLREEPNLKRLRLMLQNIADSAWINRENVQPALAHMAKTGLGFDALIQSRHLPHLLDVACTHPEQSID